MGEHPKSERADYWMESDRSSTDEGKSVNSEVWDGSRSWEVEAIKGKRKNDQGKIEYLAKWKGFGDSFNTWEANDDIEEFVDKKIVGEFESAKRNPPGSKS